jgi:hypothetical protein
VEEGVVVLARFRHSGAALCLVAPCLLDRKPDALADYPDVSHRPNCIDFQA